MLVTIHWQYKSPRGEQILLTSEALDAKTALQFAEDMQKTGRVKEMKFLDAHDSYWSVKEIRKYVQEIETEPHAIRIYFDGGFHLDTQLAGVGAVIYYEQNGKSWRLRKNAELLYVTSNNEAEYAALYEALLQLEEIGAHHVPVEIYSDSQVVIRELNGEWGQSAGYFDHWASKIELKIAQLGLQPHYVLIGRNDNKEADHLASQALKGIEIIAKTIIDQK